MFVFKDYNTEIKFYIDIIIYFTLFPTKIFYIIQKTKREKMQQNYEMIKNNIKNTTNLKKINYYKINNFRENKIFDKLRNVKNPKYNRNTTYI